MRTGRRSGEHLSRGSLARSWSGMRCCMPHRCLPSVLPVWCAPGSWKTGPTLESGGFRWGFSLEESWLVTSAGPGVDNQSKCMEGRLNSEVKAGKAWRRPHGYPGGKWQNDSSRSRFHMVKMTAKPADVHTVYLAGTRRGCKSGNVRHDLVRGTTSRPMAGFSTTWLLPRRSDGYVEFRTEVLRETENSCQVRLLRSRQGNHDTLCRGRHGR